jgi:hypothetical protein
MPKDSRTEVQPKYGQIIVVWTLSITWICAMADRRYKNKVQALWPHSGYTQPPPFSIAFLLIESSTWLDSMVSRKKLSFFILNFEMPLLTTRLLSNAACMTDTQILCLFFDVVNPNNVSSLKRLLTKKWPEQEFVYIGSTNTVVRCTHPSKMCTSSSPRPQMQVSLRESDVFCHL